MRLFNSERGRAKFLILFLLSLLSGVLLSIADLYSERGTAEPGDLPEVDALICLAGGQGRIAASAELFVKLIAQHPGKDPVFYVMGMGKDAGWEAFEAQLSPELLAKIPRHRVVLETKSRNTIENSKMILREAGARRWARVLIATSSYHLKRARYLFEREAKFDPDFKVDWIPLQIDPFTPGVWWTNRDALFLTATEWTKWVYYRATAWQP